MTQTVSEASFEVGQESTPRINFSDGNHDLHVQVLRAWIHPALRDLPGIDWSKMPSRVTGYLLNSVGNSPHAPHITLAIGTALGAVGASSLRDLVVNLNGLLKSLRASCETWDGMGMNLTRALWEEYIAKTEATPQRRCYLLAYSTITQRHMADYVERLDPEMHAQIAPYLLPPLPTRLLEQHADTATLRAGEQHRRKGKSDVLAPLHSLLVALIQFRKQASQRLLLAFREACQRAEAGEALPLTSGTRRPLLKSTTLPAA